MAQSPLHSTLWYRVKHLRPRLRNHVQLRSERYRGQLRFVLHDRANGKSHQITPEAEALLGRFDGASSIEDIWQAAQTQLADRCPTQDELIQLMGQLHAADLMQVNITPDTAELFERFQKRERQQFMARYANPMSIRIRLLDPDRMLEALHPWAGWMFGRFGLLLWLAVVLPALGLAAFHAAELSGNISDRVLSTQNLLLMGCLYPILKALHELGHGLVTKRHGGEVHEFGVLLMALFPLPYVDASASDAFPGKWTRALVGAAGMMVELFLAALAMYVWVLAEPGVVRSVAFNIMLISGASAVLFNGNPLLRYDGYYILCDLIEIPNLGVRANRYWTYLAERYLLRIDDTRPPLTTRGERLWFFFYAPAAYIYRIFVAVAVALFVATQFFFVGVIIALWGVVTMIGMPIFKIVRYLAGSPRLMKRRRYAAVLTLGGVGALLLALCVVPMPLATRAEGVVWLPDEAFVRAGADGFIGSVLARSGEPVRKGQILVVTTNDVLEAEYREAQAKVEELQIRYESEWFADRVAAGVTLKSLEQVRANLKRVEQRRDQLTVISNLDGVLVLPNDQDLPGSHVRKGQQLGYVAAPGTPIVRAVVTQQDIDLVRQRTDAIHVRLAHRIEQVIPVSMARAVPQASDELPSAALGSTGGGSFATDPGDRDGVKTLERVFQFDLRLPEGITIPGYGGRAHVRFEHRHEPLAQQWYRRLRQLLLRHLDV